jgi:PAS domain S-box-containing protein
MTAQVEPDMPDAGDIAELRERLREAEETLLAIRNGEVDAVVVHGPAGQQIYTLENADRPYRVLIEQMQEGAVTLGEEGTVLYCNERLASMIGERRETLIGEPIDRFIHGNEVHAFHALLKRRGSVGRAAEFNLRTSHGDKLPVNISLVDLVIEDSAMRVLCGVVTDLTHSRERSHELAATNQQLASEIDERRRAEDSLQLALDVADMGTWDIDLGNDVASRSPRFDRIFGHVDREEQWSREALLALFFDEDQPKDVDAFAQVEQAGTIELERCIQRRNDGVSRWVQVRGRTYYRDGRPVRIAGVVTDITDRRQVEEQLRQAQKMEAIGQLTGGIAHDFNNLLMVVGGSLDMLEQRIEKSDRTSRYLAAARHGVERGARLNQQLLAFSRRQDLRVEAICIDDLIDGFENLLDRAVGEAVTVQIRHAADLWHCRTDPHQLETAILNLAINARDAMPQGGLLTLVTAMQSIGAAAARVIGAGVGDYVVVSVMDTGAGMTPELIGRVFEPFFTTKPVGKGTGLGLSQVYGFARQSGGFVTIDSEPGCGTTVGIHLPRTGKPVAVAPVVRAAIEIKGKGIILVVEDDPAVRTVASGLLEDLGYSVLEAESGREALQVVESGQPIDLVFTDVIMPGDLNGIDLVRELKARGCELPVLLTSGYTAQHFAPEEKLIQDLQLLRKPYSQVELSLAVRMVMNAQS